MLPPVHDRESETLEKTEEKLEEPDMFRVVLHNDDFTTMEFVVHVLMKIFRHPEQVAIRVMLQVHNQGSGVAGTYTREIATTKVAETSELARQWEYPLLCTMERL
ncbi:MAG: ATP-dependent Clp protease adapter ClpS [Acidobacteria bacterium]|nr:ATP-dependent Clp protease adapter ClpS [Acidobacteriota bacterium]